MVKSGQSGFKKNEKPLNNGHYQDYPQFLFYFHQDSQRYFGKNVDFFSGPFFELSFFYSDFNPNQGGLFGQSIECGGGDSARWVLTLPECIFDIRISQKGSQMKDGIFLIPWIL